MYPHNPIFSMKCRKGHLKSAWPYLKLVFKVFGPRNLGAQPWKDFLRKYYPRVKPPENNSLTLE
jgi:hypothetical protein